jgi:hypothetical protein
MRRLQKLLFIIFSGPNLKNEAAVCPPKILDTHALFVLLMSVA